MNLGQSGTFVVVPPVVVPPVKSVTTATVKDASFGALINVTSDLKDAVKYQVFNGTAPISDENFTALGASTTIFPKKVAGEKVNVKLMNAAGTVLSTVEVTLVAAK